MSWEIPNHFRFFTSCHSQDPIAYQGIVGTPSGFGDQTYLPPKESVDMSLHFWPSKAAAQQASRPSVSGSGAPPGMTSGNGLAAPPATPHRPPGGLAVSSSIRRRTAAAAGGAAASEPPWVPQPCEDFSLQGCLVITYANGDVQRLPLDGNVSHPALDLRRPAVELHRPAGLELHRRPAGAASVLLGDSLSYGRVHVGAPKPFEIMLCNPTLVDAAWTVTAAGVRPKTAAARGLPSSSGTAAAAGVVEPDEARFGPFIVRPASGLLPGRGLRLPHTQLVTVTFAPTDAADCTQSLVFAVAKGRACTLALAGTGSFDETEEHEAPLKYKI